MYKIAEKLVTSLHLNTCSKAIITVLALMLAYSPAVSIAGQKVYFSHKSRTQVTNHHNQSRYQFRKNRVHSRKHLSTSPTGPLVINVRKALARKRLRITIHQNGATASNLKRHVIDTNSGEPRVLYYDESKCIGGYECVIRLGNKSSSPKVIVLGRKQIEKTAGPVVIYPPS